jgi:predicted negative regulator of RcsB-dependent stress response
VDELLTEDQEAERAKQWVRENGAFILAGIVVGVGGLFGWQAWQDSSLESAGQGSVVWEQLRDAVEGERYNEVDETLALLETDYASTPYLDQARLAIARMYMDRNDPESAAASLSALVTQASDPYLRRLGELRLAQIYIFQEDYAAALASLGPTETTGFEGLFHELRGDVFIAQGQLDDAREEYRRALDVDSSGVLDRSYVQIKLDDVLGSIAARAVAAAPVGTESAAVAEPAPAADE